MNDLEKHWFDLLQMAFAFESSDPRDVVRTYLRICSHAKDFNAWAQSLSPEDAAKLHYLLSAPEVPTDTSSGSGSP